MIKILIPEVKGKRKSEVRGLWLNNDNKLFYDYLKAKEVNFDYNENHTCLNSQVLDYLDFLKDLHKQEAIFFNSNDKAFIYYSKSNIEQLNTKKSVLVIGKKTLKVYAKKFLKEYKGITIYKQDKGYLLESWLK